MQGDRRWMVVDTQSGRFITQRLLGQMNQIKARWQNADELLLSGPNMPDLPVAVTQGSEDLRGVHIWRDSLRVPDAGD
ncbi:MOSC N-terminal beta barrel domain-containing protein, partial [Streptococcus suis]